jgi:ArsR family transcriptional regulator
MNKTKRTIFAGVKSKCCLPSKTLREVEKTSDFLKIISQVQRLKILCILKKGERCACDIARDIGVPQNLASHHLKTLKEGGVIESRRQGLEIIYRLKNKSLNKFDSLLNNLF